MKLLKRILFIFVTLIMLVLISAGIMIYWIGHKALPNYNESIELKGISGKVTIVRDSFAIPHIYAENEHDLYIKLKRIIQYRDSFNAKKAVSEHYLKYCWEKQIKNFDKILSETIGK